MNSVLFSMVFVFLATLTTAQVKTTKPEYSFEELFAAWHCYREMICKPGSGWICAVGARGQHVSFFDKCDFHGVNCLQQGQYLQISTAICKPVVFYGEALTAYHGEKILKYATMSMTKATRARRQVRPNIADNKTSIFTKIIDYLGISANLSFHY